VGNSVADRRLLEAEHIVHFHFISDLVRMPLVFWHTSSEFCWWPWTRGQRHAEKSSQLVWSFTISSDWDIQLPTTTWSRTWSTANEQGKQVRCLQKVIRWHPNHTWRQHEDVNFYSSLYPQDTRRLHDGSMTWLICCLRYWNLLKRCWTKRIILKIYGIISIRNISAT
jgi:hypothetical protein